MTINEQDVLSKLDKIEKHLEYYGTCYKSLHNMCIQAAHVRVSKELLEPAISNLQIKLKEFISFYEQLNDLVKKESIVGTLAFMAKRIHEMEEAISAINEEGIKKKIVLDLTMDGYEMVRKKPELIKIKSNEDAIKDLLNTLCEREATVITHRYGLFGNEEKTLEAIGNFLGVGRERVRQIQSKALRKMRHPARKNLVKSITHLELRTDILGE